LSANQPDIFFDSDGVHSCQDESRWLHPKVSELSINWGNIPSDDFNLYLAYLSVNRSIVPCIPKFAAIRLKTFHSQCLHLAIIRDFFRKEKDPVRFALEGDSRRLNRMENSEMEIPRKFTICGFQLGIYLVF
jgi:hypothetical protein